jgi:hypothetical protein
MKMRHLWKMGAPSKGILGRKLCGSAVSQLRMTGFLAERVRHDATIVAVIWGNAVGNPDAGPVMKGLIEATEKNC